jgi:integrase
VEYRDSLGERRSRQFESKAAATRWVESTDFQSLQSRENASKTFADATEAWLARGHSENLEESTLDDYHWITEAYLLPTLGKVPLAKLTEPILVSLRLEIASTKSASFAQRVILVAKMILRYAERIDIISKSPARHMKTAVRSGKKLPVIPSRRELAAILTAPAFKRPHRLGKAAYQRDTLLLSTLVESSIRPGEGRALGWPQVNLDRCTITIMRAVKRNGSIGPCKTKAGYRTIPISPQLAADLMAWKRICPPSPQELVFPTPNGLPVQHGNLAEVFRERQIAAGVTIERRHRDGTTELVAKYSLYDLRHAGASWWIHRKLDLKKLTTWMGHSSIQVTFDIYGHLIADEESDTAIMAELAADLYKSEQADGDGSDRNADRDH